ncbi:MAG: RuvA C-terminal domain-containing protein, partial [Opitutaceae bacterium]
FTGVAGPAVASTFAPGHEAPDSQHDAVKALIALGYKTADADKVVRQAWIALGPSATTEELIKKALG